MSKKTVENDELNKELENIEVKDICTETSCFENGFLSNEEKELYAKILEERRKLELIKEEIQTKLKNKIKKTIQGSIEELEQAKNEKLLELVEAKTQVYSGNLYSYWVEGDGLKKIEDWVRRGFTAKEICAKTGISTALFFRWIYQNKAFGELLKRGKAYSDIEVENALYKKCIGYNYKEVKDSGEAVVTTEKHVSPDVNAIKFWLMNRRPDLWKDKSEQVQKVEVVENPFAELSTDELRKLVKTENKELREEEDESTICERTSGVPTSTDNTGDFEDNPDGDYDFDPDRDDSRDLSDRTIEAMRQAGYMIC